MATSAPVSEQNQSGQGIAPALHTVILIAVLLAFSFAGANSQHSVSSRVGHLPFYLMTMLWEWVLVAYVIWGIRRTGRVTLRELIGGRWQGVDDALLDFAIAIGFWFASAMVLGGLAYLMGLAHPSQISEMKKKIDFLVPSNGLEIGVWVLLSATAGFCEEIIFRGYVMRQFSALSGRAIIGLLAQGLLFGASHAYEGRARMVLIAVYGVMFGILAMLRKSLRPGMMAHMMQDTVSGIAMRFIR